MFTPEFRNRLDAVVAFKSLTPEVIRMVVQKFILQLEAQLADRHVTIESSDAAIDWLAKNGFDELYGAEAILGPSDPGANQAAAGRRHPCSDALAKGGHVKVDLKDGKLTFEFDEKTAPPVRSPAESDEDPEVEAPVLA